MFLNIDTNYNAPWQGEAVDNCNEDSQLTVLDMMKMFHRENLPETELEIKIDDVKELEIEEKKDVVVETPPRKKFTPKEKVSEHYSCLQILNHDHCFFNGWISEISDHDWNP